MIVMAMLLLKTISTYKKSLLMELSSKIFYFPSDTHDDASLLLSPSPLLDSSESPVLVIRPISFKNQFEYIRNEKGCVPR